MTTNELRDELRRRGLIAIAAEMLPALVEPVGGQVVDASDPLGVVCKYGGPIIGVKRDALRGQGKQTR